jgi:hypothetical protein
MKLENRLWSMYDGEVVKPGLSGIAPPNDYGRTDSTSSYVSGQRFVSNFHFDKLFDPICFFWLSTRTGEAKV